MKVLETDRLVLRWLETEDDAFILKLVNEPSWLEHIGDKGVRTLEQARTYIDAGPRQMYRAHGFGLYLVQRKTDDAPIGICGLIRRDVLEHVDLGFALLPQYWRQGYALEAAQGGAVAREERVRVLAHRGDRGTQEHCFGQPAREARL